MTQLDCFGVDKTRFYSIPFLVHKILIKINSVIQFVYMLDGIVLKRGDTLRTKLHTGIQTI